MSENWTKGPWHVNGDKIESTIGACRARIAIIDDGAGTNPTANAHLIAAAPEMYESLMEALLLVEMSTSYRSADITEKCKAALKKARGES